MKIIDCTYSDNDIKVFKEENCYILPKKGNKEYIRLCLDEVPEKIIQFAEENSIEIIDQGDFGQVVKKMYLAGYSITPWMRCMGLIFSQVMVLLGDDQFLSQLIDTRILKELSP